MFKFITLVLLAACSGSTNDIKSYSADWEGVNQFLADECLSCHVEGGDSTLRLPSALELDLYTANGLLVVPYEPEQSRLWRVVADELAEDDFARMPMGADPLPDPTVAHIRE